MFRAPRFEILLRSRKALKLGTVAALVIHASLARADWVTFPDGRRGRCVILDMDKNTVRLRDGSSAELTLQRGDVVIERESPAENRLLIATYAYGENAVVESLMLFKAAQEAGAAESSLCAALTPVLADTVERTEELTPAARTAIVSLLEPLAKAPLKDAPADFLYNGAWLLARYGSFSDALKLYNRIPSEHFRARPERRQAFSDLIVGDLRRLLDEGNMKSAGERIEHLFAVDSARGASCTAVIHLNHAGLLRQDKDFAGALEVYARQIAPEFPEIAKDRTWALLKEAFEEARRSRYGFKPVIDLCRKAEEDVLGAGQAAEMMGLTYKAWGYALLDTGQYEAARKAFDQHYVCLPGQSKPLLALAGYREMSSNLEEGTPRNHFDLGVFCRENGLYEQAAEEFQRAARDDDWRGVADMQLTALEQERYVGELDRAYKLNEEGKYYEARELIDFLLKRIQGKEMRETAERIKRLIDASFEQARQRAPMEAELKWQSFERYYLVDPELALNILDEILRDYSGTPVAEKARLWRPKVLSLRLSDLEKRPGAKIESSPPPREDVQASDGPADPEALQREMRRIHQALETGAES